MLVLDVGVPMISEFVFPLALLHLQQVYVTWKAVNYAGLETSHTSATVTVDATLPVIAYAVDYGVGGDEVDLVGSTDIEYTMLFEASDPESAIVDAVYCVGSFPGSCDIVRQYSVDYREREARGRLTGLIDTVHYYPTRESAHLDRRSSSLRSCVPP